MYTCVKCIQPQFLNVSFIDVRVTINDARFFFFLCIDPEIITMLVIIPRCSKPLLNKKKKPYAAAVFSKRNIIVNVSGCMCVGTGFWTRAMRTY